MTLQGWMDLQLREISQMLLESVHSDSASFNCGYLSGRKAILLELGRFLNDDDADLVD